MKNIKKILIGMLIIMVGMFLSACGKFSSNSKDAKAYDYKLYNGIKLNNLEEVKEAIEDGADINKIKGVSSKESIPLTLSFNSKEKITEYLIENGADVNYKDSSGISVLMTKAFNTDVHFCELLLKHGAKIDDGDKNGDTALEYALRANSKASSESEINKLITLLLDNGAKIRPISLQVALTGAGNDDFCRYGIVKKIMEKLNEEGEKSNIDPILEAAILGDSDKVNELIKEGNIKDNIKDKVLFYTAAFGKVETIKLLEDKGFDLNTNDKKNDTLLTVASQYGNLEVAQYLCEKGMNIEAQNNDNDTALIEAARNNNYDVVKYLIQKGAKFDNIVLCGAAGNGNIDMIKFLLASGYEFTNQDKSIALESAVENNQKEAAKYLLDTGAADIDVEYNTFTPLKENCLKGNLEAVKFLVESGANIDGKKIKGEVLETAIEYGQVDIVKYLIDKGADVNAIVLYEDGSGGQSELIEAAGSGYLDIVKLLVENGADVKAQDKSTLKNTALIYASSSGSRNIVEYLIQKGSDVNCQNTDGQTALMFAAKTGQTDNVNVLLKYGADASLKDKNGKTALDLAKDKKFKEVVKILEDKE